MGSMIAILVWIGLYPQNVINTAKPTVNKVEQRIKIVKERSALSQNWSPMIVDDNSKLEQGR
jgi:NADH:ubiquinone oxidoreductase subunit 4 (subunit M)